MSEDLEGEQEGKEMRRAFLPLARPGIPLAVPTPQLSAQPRSPSPVDSEARPGTGLCRLSLARGNEARSQPAWEMERPRPRAEGKESSQVAVDHPSPKSYLLLPRSPPGHLPQVRGQLLRAPATPAHGGV